MLYMFCHNKKKKDQAWVLSHDGDGGSGDRCWVLSHGGVLVSGTE